MSDHSEDRGEGPDSNEPDRAFHDGDSTYVVSVSPASFPTRLVAGRWSLVAGPTPGGIADSLFQMGVEFLGGLVAPHGKPNVLDDAA